MKAHWKPVAHSGVLVAVVLGAACQAIADTGEPSANREPEEAESKAESRASEGNLPAVVDQRWPQVREGHYIKWVDRIWNTRKPAKIWQDGGVGILGQHNGTGTYLGEDKVNGGTVEFDVKFDAGYLAPEGGGKHFLEIMSWIADRSDREAIGARPWSRIELARLGDRPRCVVWNYGPHFRGKTTRLFPIGPAFKPDRWYRIRFDWSYREPAGRVTIHIDDRSYSSAFKFVPRTVGPGRFFLFGHVETTQPQGRLHFQNFRVSNRNLSTRGKARAAGPRTGVGFNAGPHGAYLDDYEVLYALYREIGKKAPGAHRSDRSDRSSSRVANLADMT